MIKFSDPPPPNKPPYFTSCPKSGQKAYAEEGKTKAKVSWQPPTATDPEDGTLRLKQFKKKQC